MGTVLGSNIEIMAKRAKTVAQLKREGATPARRIKTEAQRIRSSKRWTKFRTWFVKRHLFCADPYGVHARDGRLFPTDHVHHIVPLAVRPELAFRESNCMSLCAKCHGRLEAQGQ